VTVGAAHHAFSDLCLEYPDAHGVEYQLRNRFALSTGDVIELEHRYVAFTAVDARMRCEVVDHEVTCCEAGTERCYAADEVDTRGDDWRNKRASKLRSTLGKYSDGLNTWSG